MNEIWKDIKGFEGKYQISNLGAVKKRKFIHQLIAEAFIPIEKDKTYVNHKNNIRTDNRIENLEWCTQSENMLHYFRTIKKSA